MTTAKQTEEEVKKGYQECKTCGGILLMEAGFEVATSVCTMCGEHVASKEEFFNVPVEFLTKYRPKDGA